MKYIIEVDGEELQEESHLETAKASIASLIKEGWGRSDITLYEAKEIGFEILISGVEVHIN